MSETDKLVRMANQIAAFFRSYPHEQAVAGIHDHIRAFWTPVMRRGLLDRSADEHLEPLVREAMVVLSAGRSPASKEAAGPAEVGQIGSSDAG